MGINLFLVKSRSSTIQDLFLFVFTQDILHYLKNPKIDNFKFFCSDRQKDKYFKKVLTLYSTCIIINI
ncbi:hypothetical protein CSW65_13605 [Streptococcus agalactiae]|nr:hypothetical protein CSW65_13605 [Streptococcus agalactiae]